ncbi:hypothetical protein TRIP_E230046 [uncultured Spirochaetota bacterium]|jgi:arabinogalactan endo-1,4-beta-galactosidase|nr:hypothetical protein TRIP_E230046 [uncultured Spirochaetota bacterium]
MSGCDLIKSLSDDTSSQVTPLVYKENPDFIKDSVIVDSFINRAWKSGTFEPIKNLHDAGQLLKEATAKIGLHIAGPGYSQNNDIARRFFSYMQECGVQYDIAELSYPYMFGESEPVRQPYFLESESYQTLDYLKNTLGKEVFIAEFSYPAHPEGINKTPSDSYPYTEAGKRDFIEKFLRVVQSYADDGFYFYPDYYPGCNYTSGGDDQLESSGLFLDQTTPNQSMVNFN